jgi:pimeloyl-ACP methyl ester carboxylesterase
VPRDPFLDLHPDDPAWGHGFGPGTDGIRLHYVRRGQGRSVVLLHGWPGFWYDWRRVIPRLAGEADVIAPDFRGFGDSDKPDLPPGETAIAVRFAGDVVALLDALGLTRVVVAGHDVGAAVAQELARRAPDRVAALVLFNPTNPGIGARRYEPAVQPEFWYQHFHVLPWSHLLAGYNRETTELYLRHFYDHWAGRKDAVRPREFAAIVDKYARPEAMRASFDWYRARVVERRRQMDADPATLVIACPTIVRWGDADPVFPATWSDRLGETFPDLRLRVLPGVGHFVPFEAPDEAVQAIRDGLAAERRA